MGNQAQARVSSSAAPLPMSHIRNANGSYFYNISLLQEISTHATDNKCILERLLRPTGLKIIDWTWTCVFKMASRSLIAIAVWARSPHSCCLDHQPRLHRCRHHFRRALTSQSSVRRYLPFPGTGTLLPGRSTWSISQQPWRAGRWPRGWRRSGRGWSTSFPSSEASPSRCWSLRFCAQVKFGRNRGTLNVAEQLRQALNSKNDSFAEF